MQKKIIALAVAALAAAPAFAQSNVSISGWLSGGYANTHFSSGTVVGGVSTTAGYKAENQIADGRLSRLRFIGNEDLGGGLKAEFQVEQRFFTDKNDLAINQTQGVTAANAGAVGTAGAWASGDTFVGLNGGFGRVRIGRMDTYYGDGVLIDFSRATSFQSMGSMSVLNAWGVVSGANITPATLNGRFNNAVRYDTPRFSGFQGSVQWSSNPYGQDGPAAANGSRGSSWYLAANYTQGPIYAGISFLTAECEGGKDLGQTCNPATGRSAGTDKSWRLYGAYTLPMGLKIGFAYDRIDIKRYANLATGYQWKRASWVLPVTYTFGNHAVYASYGSVGKLKYGAAHATLADSSASFWNIGYDYGFSRRTSVGANITQMNNKANAGYNFFNGGGYGGALQSLGQVNGAPAGAKVRQIYVGVNHFF